MDQIAVFVVLALLLLLGFWLLHQRIARADGSADLITQLQGQVRDTQARISDLLKELGDVRQEKGQLEGVTKGLREQLDTARQHSASQESEISALRTEAGRVALDLNDARSKATLAAKEADRDRAVSQEAEAARKQAEDRREEATTKARTLESEHKLLKARGEELHNEIQQVRMQRDDALAAASKATLAENNAAAHSKAMQEKVDELRLFVDNAQRELRLSFVELAKQAMAEQTAELEKHVQTSTEKSRTDIDALLKPLQERLHEFRTRVDEVHTAETREMGNLLGQVNQLNDLNQRMASSTESLTKALTGNSKVRGDWGELALETVLEASGLVEGQHFEKQVSVSTEDGHRRPDVIVKLPGDRRIIIDAKALLLNWQAAINCDSVAEQAELMKAHAATLRSHVAGLSEKRYPMLMDGEVLDFTIAFIPIEGALSAAIAADPQLQSEAFAKRVALATPNTLIAMLSLCGKIWQRDQVQRQAEEISRTGSLLLTSVENFMGSFDKIGRSLESATTAHRDAQKQLKDSNQSVTARAEKLRDLGIRLLKPQRTRKTKSTLAGGQSSESQGLLEPLDSEAEDIELGLGDDENHSGGETRSETGMSAE